MTNQDYIAAHGPIGPDCFGSSDYHCVPNPELNLSLDVSTPCDHPVMSLVKKWNDNRSKLLPGLWCDECGAHLKYTDRVADGLSSFDNPKAIPVPPRRVVHVLSHHALHKDNVASLALSGGFDWIDRGVKS